MADDPDADPVMDAIESARAVASDPEKYQGERAHRLARYAAKLASDAHDPAPLTAAALTLLAAGVEPTVTAVEHAARDLPEANTVPEP